MDTSSLVVEFIITDVQLQKNRFPCASNQQIKSSYHRHVISHEIYNMIQHFKHKTPSIMLGS